MLQQRSLLFILDNSGAKKARCIQVRNKPKRGVASIADQVTVSIQQLTSNNVKLKKGQLAQVLVLTTRKKETRADGSYSNFDLNSGIVLETNGKPAGSRILGPTSDKLRNEVFARVAALAPALV
jgi:large subunit ribosomal protein L14